MYKIYCDGNLIYHPNLEELKINNATVEIEQNEVGSFSFTMYPTNPYINSIKKKQSIIEVYDDNFLLFKGLAIDETVGFNNSRNIKCKDEYYYLSFSLVEPFEFQGTPKELFEKIITEHNSQVSYKHKLKIGNCTVTDANDYIVRSNQEYSTSWECLKDKLIDMLGGYLVIRHESDGSYIDYLSDFNTKNIQEINFGSNLLECTKEESMLDVYTVLIPFGAENEETKERLTIESVNGGVKYIEHEEGVSKYGRIATVEYWDDVTEAKNLLTKAQKRLNELVYGTRGISITAVDLSRVDKDIKSIRMYSKIKVSSEKHGLNDYYVPLKMSIDLFNVANNKIQLDSTKKAFTDIIVTNGKDGATGTGVESITTEFYLSDSKEEQTGGEWVTSMPTWETGKYLWTRSKIVYTNPSKTVYTAPICDSSWEASNNVKEELEGIIDNVTNQNSSAIVELRQELTSQIINNKDSIMSEVSEKYYTSDEANLLQSSLSTQIEQTKEDITFTFDSYKSEVDKTNDATNTKFEEISKYIRFVDGKIVLGEVGNELELKIANDRIQFLQGGFEVAYFSNSKLYVTDGEYTNSLQLGNFAFVPRKDGSLSFKKVV